MRSHFPIVALLSVGTALLSSPDAYAQETRPVRVTVVDADTSAPLPCRVYLGTHTDQVAWYFAKSDDPAGSAVKYDVARSPTSLERHTTVSAHPFTFEVPPGEYVLTVERGKEYVTYEAVLTVADKPVEHAVKLQRWTNMAERGWYSGDTHVHRSLEELPNVMLAEDLNVALPLSYWVRDAYTPPAQAERPASARDGDKSVGVKAELTQVDPTHVFWPVNTEYELFTVNGQRHTLGAVFVLNHKEPLRPAAPPVGPVAAEARAQGAILDLDKHSWPWSMMLMPVMNVDLFELSNNHVWRTEFFFKQWTIDQLPEEWNIEHDADGFTGWGWLDFGFKTYYALLNCGFRMRPTGGTASGVHPVPLGFGRVYVELPDGFSYEKWMAGLNAGRSFVTTGPMLFATVGDQPPGSTIKVDGPTTVRVQGTAEGARPLSRIEIVKNGQVVEVIAPAIDPLKSGVWRSGFDKQIAVDGTSWIAVRVFEADLFETGMPAGTGVRFAHSAPVFIEVPDRPLHPRKHETAFLVRRMEIEIDRNRNVLKPDEVAEYEHALSVYRKLDAEAIPERRMSSADLNSLLPADNELPDDCILMPISERGIFLPGMTNPWLVTNPVYIDLLTALLGSASPVQENDVVRMSVGWYYDKRVKGRSLGFFVVATEFVHEQSAENVHRTARTTFEGSSNRVWQQGQLVVWLIQFGDERKECLDAAQRHIDERLKQMAGE